MDAILTRVGQIIDGDNRFMGRSVFEEWIHEITNPSDALLVALGVPELTALNREALRLISLCSMSPDARVWPLKLTRLLSSWGDPIAGFFGGQLVTAGRVMGPGAAVGSARCLHWISARIASLTLEDVGEALAAWKVENPGPVGGFGVPFRPADERRVALLRFVGAGPLSRRRYWKLHELVAASQPTPANCILSFAALLLDIGIAPERCGLAVSVLMPHVFLAHALEAAHSDAGLHAWPATAVEYSGRPARRTADGTVGEGPRGETKKALRRAPLA